MKKIIISLMLLSFYGIYGFAGETDYSEQAILNRCLLVNGVSLNSETGYTTQGVLNTCFDPSRNALNLSLGFSTNSWSAPQTFSSTVTVTGNLVVKRPGVNGYVMQVSTNSSGLPLSFYISSAGSDSLGTTYIGTNIVTDLNLSNTLCGYDVGRPRSDNNDTLFGNNAGGNISTGGSNTCVGSYCGFALGNGNYNTLCGTEAGLYLSAVHNNTAFGYRAARVDKYGTYLSGASSCLYLGYSTKSSSHTGVTNEIVVGANAEGGGSNTAVIGDNNIINTILKGNISARGTVTIGTAPVYNSNAPFLEVRGIKTNNNDIVFISTDVYDNENPNFRISKLGFVAIGSTATMNQITSPQAGDLFVEHTLECKYRINTIDFNSTGNWYQTLGVDRKSNTVEVAWGAVSGIENFCMGLDSADDYLMLGKGNDCTDDASAAFKIDLSTNCYIRSLYPIISSSQNLGSASAYWGTLHVSTITYHSFENISEEDAVSLIKGIVLDNKSTYGKSYIPEKKYNKIITKNDENVEVEIIEHAGVNLNTIIESLIVTNQSLLRRIETLEAKK